MNASLRSITRLARPVLARPLVRTPRTFTTLSPLRPTLTAPTAAFRPNTTSFVPASAAAADVVPAGAITSHPALAGGAAQLRCGPRNTMNGHTRLIQKRRSGFLARVRSKSGRRVLLSRRTKGRKRLAW
ncbi:hypothetical protein S7711_04965 [Stachybotrys chartarum IBT 7711]|uniref:Ribosomal protein L34 n=1 Tax=Stachybotrys chartarum (strain CBS 109288 / IBT 7711) TaxID=1280523 RepID=A0A084AR98_STACB|nr:hypothetical protein S7711_04965 [Stachybotrys chartarum IBT 7711]